jgi:hypothetical protein
VDKSGSDEIRTYDTGFVGVDLPVLTSLPRMLEAEKEQILGKNNGAEKPAAWSRAGVPLFWQEAKFWPQLCFCKRVQLIGLRSVASTYVLYAYCSSNFLFLSNRCANPHLNLSS